MSEQTMYNFLHPDGIKCRCTVRTLAHKKRKLMMPSLLMADYVRLHWQCESLLGIEILIDWEVVCISTSSQLHSSHFLYHLHFYLSRSFRTGFSFYVDIYMITVYMLKGMITFTWPHVAMCLLLVSGLLEIIWKYKQQYRPGTFLSSFKSNQITQRDFSSSFQTTWPKLTYKNSKLTAQRLSTCNWMTWQA